MDEYDLENAYDEESRTVALEGDFDIEALENILDWLKRTVADPVHY
jgi:hypothetical protein